MMEQTVEKERTLSNLVEAEFWPEHAWLPIKAPGWCESNFLGTEDTMNISRVMWPQRIDFLSHWAHIIGAEKRFPGVEA